MKKYLAVLCASMLCVCCLALAACGGGSSASSGSAAVSGSTASASAADPTEKFLGTWKLAAIEMDGVTMVGDFSSGVLGTDMNMEFTFKDDGKATASFNGENADFTWELVDDNSIAMKTTDSSSKLNQITAAYKDDTLSFEMNDETMTGTVILSKTGTVENLETINIANAKNATKASEIVGTWKFSGMSMGGVSVYGDSEKLSALMGAEVDSTLTINEDGTAIAMGENVTWTLNSNGANLSLTEGVTVPLKLLGDALVLDVSELLGGTEYCMLFSK